ncbi:hypothetical protein Hanom_Chr00s002805g01704901 [Helianthus anomalus]
MIVNALVFHTFNSFFSPYISNVHFSFAGNITFPANLFSFPSRSPETVLAPEKFRSELCFFFSFGTLFFGALFFSVFLIFLSV